MPNWKAATIPAREIVAGRYCQLEPLGAHHAAGLWREIADFPELWDYLSDGSFADSAGFAA